MAEIMDHVLVYIRHVVPNTVNQDLDRVILAKSKDIIRKILYLNRNIFSFIAVNTIHFNVVSACPFIDGNKILLVISVNLAARAEQEADDQTKSC